MPASKPESELAASTKKIYEILQRADLSPRMRMALRMYAFGAVPTLSAAAEAVGVSLPALSMKKNSPAGQAYMQSVQQILDDKTASTSQILSQLGRKAIEVIAERMEKTDDPKLQLRAAIDLADRAPETSKVQKLQVESFTIAGKDAKAIAQAMVEASSVKEEYKALMSGNHDNVTPEAQDGTPKLDSDTQHS